MEDLWSSAREMVGFVSQAVATSAPDALKAGLSVAVSGFKESNDDDKTTVCCCLCCAPLVPLSGCASASTARGFSVPNACALFCSITRSVWTIVTAESGGLPSVDTKSSLI